MEPEKYLRKWEELNRSYRRLKKFYDSFIQDGEDSFQGPKDYLNNFFRISYELKEALKKSPDLPIQLKGYNGEIEQFVDTNYFVALSIDISNKEKHMSLKSNRSNSIIGAITSHVNIHDLKGRDRTEMKIEINGKREDCLELATKIIEAWKVFLIEKKLLIDEIV